MWHDIFEMLSPIEKVEVAVGRRLVTSYRYKCPNVVAPVDHYSVLILLTDPFLYRIDGGTLMLFD